MTGMPAARRDDMTLKGGPIIQGSLTVMIGGPTGIACSSCADAVTISNPVNPLLGAKVQSGEVDLALPGPLPFVIARDYSSYQTDMPAPVGLLGPGWWLPNEVSLLQTTSQLTLNDSKGRSIRFDPLAPGQASFSRSEGLWIVRGGLERLGRTRGAAASCLDMAWQGLQLEDRLNSSFFFVTSSPLGPWWILGSHPTHGEILDKRLYLLGLNDRFERTQRFLRNADGVLMEAEDGVGRRFRLEHKGFPQLVAHSGAHGWGADNGMRLVAVHLVHDPHESTLPTTALVRYDYSPAGELITVSGRDGHVLRHFQYHPRLPGRMTSHAHAGRHAVNYVYDEQGKVVELQREGLLSHRLEYATDSTTVFDTLGRRTVFHFKGTAGLRRVVKVERPDGSATQSQFDSGGHLTASIDPLGRETNIERDIAGNVTVLLQPDGLKAEFEYNDHGQRVRYIDPATGDESMEYDTLARLVTSTDALGHKTRYHYATGGSDLPSVIEDARGGRKLLEWNAVGLLTSFTDCSGSVTRYRYDRWGQLVETRGEEGASNTSEHDSRGRLIAQSNALGQRTAYQYNEAGNLVRITGPDGNSVHFDRDAHGRVQVYHYGGFTQRFAYDEADRIVTLTNENGAITTFEYDQMDRLVKQVNFDGRTQKHRYNAAGELIETDDEGLISHYVLDKGGRVIQRRISSTEKPNSTQDECFQYAKNGLLQKAWHHTAIGGNTVIAEFIRDAMGRITEEKQRIIGVDSSEVWHYSVQRAFNELGVEAQTTYEGLPVIDWQTYGPGHLLGMSLDGRSLMDFERDKLHREVHRQFGEVQVTKTYDALSRLEHLNTTSPLIGNELDRVHHYDTAGQLVRIDTSKGPHEYGYDMAGRLTSAVQPGMDLQHYRFDPAGNRIFENHSSRAAQDNWAQTVNERLSDKAFNLLGENSVQASNDTQPKWMDNRITDDGEYCYEYDRWGNTRRKYKAEKNEQHHFIYDRSHRLIRYAFESDEAVRGANYHYDVFGRRLVKQVQHGDGNGELVGEVETTFFGWDGDILVLEEKDRKQIRTIYEPGSFIPMLWLEIWKKIPKPNIDTKHYGQASDLLEYGIEDRSISSIKKQYLRQAGFNLENLVGKSEVGLEIFANRLDSKAFVESGHLYMYQCDHLGTPTGLLSEEGHMKCVVALNSWGANFMEFKSEELYQPIRFQGQQWDRESGLHYNRHRFYDPRLGRYIGEDPIGLSGGSNFYLYARSPQTMVDPRGLAARVAIRGRSINIDASINMKGEGDLVTLRGKWQGLLEKSWNNGPWNYGRCSVNIKVTLTCNKSRDLNEVVVLGAGEVNPLSGDRGRAAMGGDADGFFFEDMRDTDVIHEVGHVLRLKDRYSDVRVNGQIGSAPTPGWEGNIMSGGQGIDQRNIDEMVERYFDSSELGVCR